MAEIQVPIIRGDKTTSRTDYADSLPKNLLAVPKEIRGATGYLISHPGLTRTVTAGGVCRGAFWNDRQRRHFMVSGNKLITVDSLSSFSEIGPISGSGQCSMPYSFQSQLVVSGGNVYRYDGSTLTLLTDSDFGRPIDADWIDGYYFFTDGEYLYHTTIADETQVGSTDYAVAEIMPDASLGVLRTPDNLMMVFGRYSIEYFNNDASENFAFSRITQKSMEIGICGTYCKTRMLGQVFILGSRRYESPAIYAISAGDAQMLSTRTVNSIINQYSDSQLAGAVLESRVDGDDNLLLVRLPDHTLIFNIAVAQVVGAENAWSILSTGVDNAPWIGCNGVYNPSLAKWIYGSTQDGAVFVLDFDTASQDGQYTESEFSTPLIYAPSVRIGKVELNTVSGFNTEEVSVFISMSDNGQTDSTEFVQLYGSAGDYNTRFTNFGFGYFNQQFSIKCRVSSKDKVNFSGLKVTYG